MNIQTAISRKIIAETTKSIILQLKYPIYLSQFHREENGQTVVDIDVCALGEDAEAVKEAIIIAMKVFVADARIGGIDVNPQTLTVDDTEIGRFPVELLSVI